jgi:peptide/nickel transport system substrate-binding protein
MTGKMPKLVLKASLCIILVTAAVLLPSLAVREGESDTNLGPSQTATESLEPKDAAPYGETLIKGSIADASVLIPALAVDVPSLDVAKMIYNGLVKYDKNINLVGDLAERWEVFDDGLRIRFHLRKGVTWHDGRPFTSRDVEYTFQLCIDSRTPTAYASDFLRVRRLTVLDDYTVEVVYDKPFAPALESWTLGMLPRHLLEGTDVTQSPLQQRPIGTGPYRFTEWKTGDRIVLEAYPGYFEGRPRLGRVVTRVVPDAATMFLHLRAGLLDWIELSPIQFLRQTDTEWFRDQFRKYPHLGFTYNYLGYNLEDPKFKDKRVRQAITLALDREGIVQGVLLGLGCVAHCPYKPDTFWHNPRVRKFPYDPEQAKRLLADAGWKDTDDDGILERDGIPFEFTLITNQGNILRKNAAAIIQRDLRKVGIKVNIRTIEWACFLKHFVHRRNFEAYLMGWRLGADPNQIDIWHSTKTAEHQLNHVSYKNPQVDNILELGSATFDLHERKKYYDRFQEIIAEDQPYTFLWVAQTLPIVHARFRGVEPGPMGIDHNLDKWYVPVHQQKYRNEP